PTSTTVSIDLLVDKLIPCFWLLRIKQELRLLAEFTRPTSDRLLELRQTRRGFDCPSCLRSELF
ncbi:hypothetical protein, partial [Consotaella aegiceratis]|uniref:hypothetical protein n=1 Tax=Consotaella aegiceratis TaxID=3097961 RepID=UPI002F400FBA